MIFLKLLEVLLPPIFIVGVIGFGAFRFVRYLERVFGITSGQPERELLETLERARSLVGSIQEKLAAIDPDHPDALRLELEELVEKRLPEALDRQRRLLTHLAGSRRSDLVREERDLVKKLKSTEDQELLALLERNLQLVRDRLETLDRLELAGRKASAQVRAVMINLEAFEDRLVASEIGRISQADRQIEALVEDVKLLEAAYDEIQLDE